MCLVFFAISHVFFRASRNAFISLRFLCFSGGGFGIKCFGVQNHRNVIRNMCLAAMQEKETYRTTMGLYRAVRVRKCVTMTMSKSRGGLVFVLSVVQVKSYAKRDTEIGGAFFIDVFHFAAIVEVVAYSRFRINAYCFVYVVFRSRRCHDRELRAFFAYVLRHVGFAAFAGVLCGGFSLYEFFHFPSRRGINGEPFGFHE